MQEKPAAWVHSHVFYSNNLVFVCFVDGIHIRSGLMNSLSSVSDDPELTQKRLIPVRLIEAHYKVESELTRA